MIAANTTKPMATPAKPGGALRWMTPKITNTRMNVPTNSAKKPCTCPTPKPLVERRHAEPDLVRSGSEHADDGQGADAWRPTSWAAM